MYSTLSLITVPDILHGDESRREKLVPCGRRIDTERDVRIVVTHQPMSQPDLTGLDAHQPDHLERIGPVTLIIKIYVADRPGHDRRMASRSLPLLPVWCVIAHGFQDQDSVFSSRRG